MIIRICMHILGEKNSICCCDCSVLTVNRVKDGTLRICMNCFPLEIIAGKCIFAPVESAFILLFISNLEASIQGKKNELSKKFWPSFNVAYFVSGLLIWKKLFIDCLICFFISFLWSIFSLLNSVYNYGKQTKKYVYVKKKPLDWHLLDYLGVCYGSVFPNIYLQNGCGFTLETLTLWCALLLPKVLLLWVNLLRSITIF